MVRRRTQPNWRRTKATNVAESSGHWTEMSQRASDRKVPEDRRQLIEMPHRRDWPGALSTRSISSSSLVGHPEKLRRVWNSWVLKSRASNDAGSSETASHRKPLQKTVLIT